MNKITNVDLPKSDEIAVDELIKRISDVKSQLMQCIAHVDDRIRIVVEQRDRILHAPVSMSEFVEYIRKDLLKKSDIAIHRLKEECKQIPVSFSGLEAQCGSYMVNYFGGLPGAPVVPEILMLYIGDVVAKQMAKALGKDRFSDEEPSVAERQVLVTNLNTELTSLREQRAALVDKLNQVGMVK